MELDGSGARSEPRAGLEPGAGTEILTVVGLEPTAWLDSLVGLDPLDPDPDLTPVSLD